MKKTCIFMLFLISVSCTLIFAGCSMVNSVKSISFLDNGEEIVIEIGKFDYDNYKINVSYSDGKTEEITLTEDMVSAYDKLKFYQVGEQLINIKYYNCSCEIKICVQRKSLNELVFEDKMVVYTGNPVVMEVEGNIPADIEIRYPSGNSFSNAGIYEITAICYGDNYTTKELTATLTIKKAQYDMSNIKFENATYTYDNSPKSVSISGTLPDDVRVEYSIGEKRGNSATDAGEYEVVASFSSKNSNYEQIQDKKAILKINKIKYADFDLKFYNKNVVYDSHSHSIDADMMSVPSGVTAYYTIQQIKNAIGENIESEPKNGNEAILAGTYIVRVNFLVQNTTNYENIEPKSATLFIDRAVYKIDNVYMDGKSVVYDGSAKSIELSSGSIGSKPELPFGVSVTYTTKMIKDKNGNEIDGVMLEGNSATNAGTYEISAHFSSDDENYKEISDIVGNLEIGLAEHANFQCNMFDLSVVFDGTTHSIVVDYLNLPKTITIKYTIKKTKTSSGEIIENPDESEGNSAIEVGTYEISATFIDSDENYVEISPLTAILVIQEVA